MPQWIHDRAKHIQAKNPSMPESEAWGIATKQFKTKEAFAMITSPFDAVMVEAFSDELQQMKTAGLFARGGNAIKRGIQGLTGKARTKVTGAAGRIVSEGLMNDPTARANLTQAIVTGAKEKMLAKPKRLMELLRGGKEMTIHGPGTFVPEVKRKWLGIFPRSPIPAKYTHDTKTIRPGNSWKAFTGKSQSLTPGEVKTEALKSLAARGAVGVAGGGAALYGARKIKNHFSMPPLPGYGDYQDGYQKQANMSSSNADLTAPANPIGMAGVKSTSPNKPLSGKTPSYTTVHSAPTLTPAASHQPVSAPPAVRS